MQTEINGKNYTLSQEKLAQNLLHFLREELDLTGAKNGCGIGVCGACTILIDDTAVRACKKTVQDIATHKVLTIEGFKGRDGGLHPLQQAFIEAGAIQCGFCTPAMVLTAHAFLLKNSNPTRLEVRKAINANLCRCTGYQQIVDAVMAASAYYRK